MKKVTLVLLSRGILCNIAIALSTIQLTLGQIIVANTYTVNTDIYDTIQGEYISGLVTYNPETRTLTLENATIVERTPEPMESSDGVLVFEGTHINRLDTINIKLLGDNVLIAHSPIGWGITGYYCTQINILGPGSLVVGGFPGMSLDYVQELTVQEGATVRFPQPTATGFEYVGIASHYERTRVLVDSSTLICEVGTPFTNIADLQLSGCHIAYPVDAYFSELTGTIMNTDNTAVNGYFEIVPGSGIDVAQYVEENSVTLFPNPVKEIVNIQCAMHHEQCSGASVEVFDIYGKLLQTIPMSSEITTFSVSGLDEGIYFVHIVTRAGIINKPFVKK